MRGLTVSITLVCTCAGAFAAPEEPRSDWFGYERLDFVIDGRDCLLVLPKRAAEGKPWIWRMEFFGHEPQADIGLLEHGFHVAYMDVQNMYGAPVALDHMDAFYAHLTAERGLSQKGVLEGFSRGGLFAFNWAVRHPDRVACIYNDAPVCDFKSWPGGKGRGPGSAGDWDLLKQVHGLTEEQALAYAGNPVDSLAPLAAAGIPLLHVCGETDTVVPIEENTRVVEARYRELGGEILVISKPNCDHHPHSMQDPTRIVNFILAHVPGLPDVPIREPQRRPMATTTSPCEADSRTAASGSPPRSVAGWPSWAGRSPLAAAGATWCARSSGGGSPRPSSTSSTRAFRPTARRPMPSASLAMC